jgi:hypothetical protein
LAGRETLRFGTHRRGQGPIEVLEFDLILQAPPPSSLDTMVLAVELSQVPAPGLLFVVGGRPEPSPRASAGDGVGPILLPSFRPGSAADRNVGLRASRADWVVFVDQGSAVRPGWLEGITADIARARPDVAVAGAAYRRETLAGLGGFDERLRTGARVDADAALRLTRAGWLVGPGGGWVARDVGSSARSSVRRQRVRADDAVMRAIHGRSWRRSVRKAGWPLEPDPPGQSAEAALLLGAGLVSLVAARNDRWKLAGLAAACWAAGTARLASTVGLRRTLGVDGAALAAAMIPPAAVAADMVGALRARTVAASPERQWRLPSGAPLGAVLFDRDGTLLVDAPADGDPANVRPAPGARQAVERVRAAGLAVGLLEGRGPDGGRERPTHELFVRHRVDALLGPFDVIEPPAPRRRRDVRSNEAELVARAARRLGLDPRRCAVVGDQGHDVAAGLAAGARAVLVPNGATLGEDLRWAPDVAPTIEAAVERLLEPASAPSG